MVYIVVDHCGLTTHTLKYAVLKLKKIVSKNSQCGNTTYNKCEKICCDGQVSDKFQNNVPMSCCGRNTYDISKQICCGGNVYKKFVCSKQRWWRRYYIHETKCSNGRVRSVATETSCGAVEIVSLQGWH